MLHVHGLLNQAMNHYTRFLTIHTRTHARKHAARTNCSYSLSGYHYNPLYLADQNFRITCNILTYYHKQEQIIESVYLFIFHTEVRLPSKCEDLVHHHCEAPYITTGGVTLVFQCLQAHTHASHSYPRTHARTHACTQNIYTQKPIQREKIMLRHVQIAVLNVVSTCGEREPFLFVFYIYSCYLMIAVCMKL